MTGLRGRTVLTEDGSLEARAVLVATDPVTAGALLPGLEVPDLHALTTYFHVCAEPAGLAADAAPGRDRRPGGQLAGADRRRPRLRPGRPVAGGLDRARPAPTRCPRAVVRRELARIYAVPTDHWAHLHTAEIRHALPAFRPGRPVRSPVELGDGIFVAGDHRDTPSTQGALVSGRRAAQAIARRARRSVSSMGFRAADVSCRRSPPRSGWISWRSSTT